MAERTVKPVEPFDGATLEGIAKALGDTVDGLSGTEIGHFLAQCGVLDQLPTGTKWKRIFNSLALQQNVEGSGNHAIAFINKAINPARYVNARAKYDKIVGMLVPVLAFRGLTINAAGKVATAPRATSLDDALARASNLKTELERRDSHTLLLQVCKAELLQENYYHAVFEAMKGVAERLRQMSGLGSDGAELVTAVFALGSAGVPMFAINSLANDSERSEQRGFTNLLVGMFGMFRNPVAHAPRVSWNMSRTDAVDMLGTISLVHRKLDLAYRLRP